MTLRELIGALEEMGRLYPEDLDLPVIVETRTPMINAPSVNSCEVWFDVMGVTFDPSCVATCIVAQHTDE